MVMGDPDTNYSFICAVREGNLERLRELISAHGLCYSQAWSHGYVLLRCAVKNKYTEVAKLLLEKFAKLTAKTQNLLILLFILLL